MSARFAIPSGPPVRHYDGVSWQCTWHPLRQASDQLVYKATDGLNVGVPVCGECATEVGESEGLSQYHTVTVITDAPFRAAR